MIEDVVTSQIRAALRMLRSTIESCPETLWNRETVSVTRSRSADAAPAAMTRLPVRNGEAGSPPPESHASRTALKPAITALAGFVPCADCGIKQTFRAELPWDL